MTSENWDHLFQSNIADHSALSNSMLALQSDWDMDIRSHFALLLENIITSAANSSDQQFLYHLEGLVGHLVRGSTSVTSLRAVEALFSMEAAVAREPMLFLSATIELKATGVAADNDPEHPLDWYCLLGYAFRCAAHEDTHCASAGAPPPSRFLFFNPVTGEQTLPESGTVQRHLCYSKTLPSQVEESAAEDHQAPIALAWICSLRDSNLESSIRNCCPKDTQESRTMDHQSHKLASIHSAPKGFVTHPQLNATFSTTFLYQVEGYTLWLICPPSRANLLGLSSIRHWNLDPVIDMLTTMEGVKVLVT
ncbi:hypothetical protein DL93DRAFT_2092365, partial [Clavulina sp. PMI_390]